MGRFAKRRGVSGAHLPLLRPARPGERVHDRATWVVVMNNRAVNVLRTCLPTTITSFSKSSMLSTGLACDGKHRGGGVWLALRLFDCGIDKLSFQHYPAPPGAAGRASEHAHHDDAAAGAVQHHGFRRPDQAHVRPRPGARRCAALTPTPRHYAHLLQCWPLVTLSHVYGLVLGRPGGSRVAELDLVPDLCAARMAKVTNANGNARARVLILA